MNYVDVAVVDEVIAGFKLTGWAPRTGVFDPDVRRPQLTLDQLKKMTPGLNASILRAVDESPVDQTTEQVWQETWQEVDKGWIRPANSTVGCSVAKRFGLQQGAKTRMIDDFSISKVNHTYGMKERLRVQALDELCAYLATLMDGANPSSLPRLKGRTFDRKSAYKQYGVDTWHSNFLQICVRDPAGGHGLFNVNALPFGATGSVTGFLRISNALAFIGIHGLDLIWSAFFDDYTVVCDEREENNVTLYVESLFRLLVGISFAAEGDKAPPFQTRFRSLGLEFDLENLQHGSFSLHHTAKRKQELLDTIASLLARKRVSPKELERLHGRLVWFSSFVFGRVMNHSVKEISAVCRSCERSVGLEQSLKDALIQVRALLETCKPLEITKSLCRTWIIFTDGAFEPDSSHPATVGGVLICPGGSVMQCFGESLHGTLVDELLSQSQHPIYELEVLPLLLALQTWGPLISGSPVVFFLDNDAARAAYVKGVGATLFAESVAQKFVCLESKLKILPWFGRVPSHSNISDGPSRLDFSNPLLQQCTRVRIPFPAHFNQMGLASGVLEKPN